MTMFRIPALLAAIGLALPCLATAEIDIRNATVETLDNGLTLILLPDRHFPVVSVQALYRVGARNEEVGLTGLAHFLEHMAFRDSRNFPDTDLVSRIYAIGGEWHGYTWTDQTTYFSTVPKENLDLLLQIEADRMGSLLIAKDDMDAERGAVLAEMHMYENSPSSMLVDAVNMVSFLQHPYRNNSIGWESDIENLQHSAVVDFYKQHYHPANAVIAIVGDFEPGVVQKRVRELFGNMPKKAVTPLPHTREPVQKGVRRIELRGNSDERQFVIAYRAPSVNSPDFAAFLVLQELLGAGSGVSFLQNDWGTPATESSILYGAADNLATWYPPSEQDYVFTISGFARDDQSTHDVETAIEQRIASVRQEAPTETAIASAIRSVRDELVFDIETTEDAAHQLAFFDGLHALDTLFELPQHVAGVTASDVRRVAAHYLLPERRTIAWHLPSTTQTRTALEPSTTRTVAATPRAPAGGIATPAATSSTLGAGIPVIVQPSSLSSTAQLQIVFGSNRVAGATANHPVTGYSSLTYRVRPAQLADTISQARTELANLQNEAQNEPILSTDPETRLEQTFAGIMQFTSTDTQTPLAPALIVVSGDVDRDDVLRQIEKTFGDIGTQQRPPSQAATFKAEDMTVSVGKPVAQAQLGYIVPAPAPREEGADAHRLLLYVLSHAYEGRLGKKAISDRGLAYYISSEYRSDGTNAWITLSTGVDSEKIQALKSLLAAELVRLKTEAPSAAEIREAKQHLLGRLQSRAQSNDELATQLATQLLWYGETITVEALRKRLDLISRQDVLDVIPAFIDGTTIVVAE